VLEVPQVFGETLTGTEDLVLRIPSSALLTNDTSANAAADPSQPILTITAVANPTHGQVGLNNGVNGIEVVFIPDANFHGIATFTYTVTDQYGLQSTARATLEIAAVNDAPVTTGESGNTLEDTAVYFNIADLLQNDIDVDTATDGQTLSISGIASSKNGIATLTNDGRIKFVPDANFHGVASFTYIVSDSNGRTVDSLSKLGASPNKGGRVQVAKCSKAKRSASSPDPNWLGRLAARPSGVRAAGQDGCKASNDVAWRVAA
jgi:hypothetical protein